jgi:hypothetical protein
MLVHGTLLVAFLVAFLVAPTAHAQTPPPVDRTAAAPLPLFEVISVKRSYWTMTVQGTEWMSVPLVAVMVGV